MAVNNLPFRDIRKVASMATTFFVIFDQTLSYRIQWCQREKLVLQLMSLLTHVSLMEKPGGWFLLTKCVKKTSGRATS